MSRYEKAEFDKATRSWRMRRFEASPDETARWFRILMRVFGWRFIE